MFTTQHYNVTFTADLISPPLPTPVYLQANVPAGPSVYDRSEGAELVLVRWPSGRQAAINTLVVQATVILLTHHPGPGEHRTRRTA